MANKNFKVKNSITIPEPLAITEGGTGQTSAGNALNALLPVQSSAANKFLQSDGSNVSWVANVAYQRGGTGSRPGSPTVGDLYYNTDTNVFEQYTSLGWFAIAAAPSAPTSVVATNQGSGRAYNNGQASVAFSAGTSGGATSTFTVTPSPSTSPTTFTGSSSPITVTGLASSTQYTYTVTGSSAYGTSSASSASSGVTATTVPQAPTVSAASASETTATITITAGATGGAAISQYTITSDPATTTQTTSSSPYTFTGLTTGTSYTFTATATNANGTSLSSSASNSIIPANPDPGSMFQIGAVTLTSGASSVTFSSIPQTYTHLQLRAIGRATEVAPDSVGYLQFNGDTSSNYAVHTIRGNGTNVVASGELRSNIVPFRISGGSSSANIFGGAIIDILDYTNTNKFKTTRALSGHDENSTNGVIVITSGLWRSTSSVSSITLTTDPTWATYSSFALYGIKGA